MRRSCAGGMIGYHTLAAAGPIFNAPLGESPDERAANARIATILRDRLDPEPV